MQYFLSYKGNNYQINMLPEFLEIERNDWTVVFDLNNDSARRIISYLPGGVNYSSDKMLGSVIDSEFEAMNIPLYNNGMDYFDEDEEGATYH